MKTRLVLVAGLLTLSGCVTSALDRVRPGDAGAAAGGAVASQIITAMKGGLIGGPLGEGLDGEDRRMGLESEYRALEYMPAGQGVKWQGSGSLSGEVTAAQPYRVGSQDCRQYKHEVTVGATRRSARGTACRNADGSWTPLT